VLVRQRWEVQAVLRNTGSLTLPDFSSGQGTVLKAEQRYGRAARRHATPPTLPERVQRLGAIEALAALNVDPDVVQFFTLSAPAPLKQAGQGVTVSELRTSGETARNRDPFHSGPAHTHFCVGRSVRRASDRPNAAVGRLFVEARLATRQ